MTRVFLYEDVTRQTTAAASLLAEGRAMLDAITADFAAIPDVALVDEARDADYALIIAPEIGGRLETLVRDSGVRLLGPSLDAIRLTSDKLALFRHWNALGVPTPRTWEWHGEPGPLVLKPRDGAGSKGVRLLLAASDPCDEPERLLAQEFVPGFAASVAFLIGESMRIPLVPCQQILSSDGRFSYHGGRLPIASNLAERAVHLAERAVTSVPGLFGYVGVDVILGDDGRDWAIEINPRLTTSYIGLRALSQTNLAQAMLDVARGLSPKLDWRDDRIEFLANGLARGKG